jgi:Na+/proline symporter
MHPSANYTGAFVASTIWPVAAGLYWRRTNPAGAMVAMALNSIIGLYSYFISFYVGRLCINDNCTPKHLALA